MALVKPKDLDFSNQKFSMIVAGHPGIGKTTLGLSAPKPLLIDADNGIARVSAKFRKDSLQVSTYDELLNDLSTLDLSAYETIVVDTGAELLELMKPYIIAKNTQNGQRDGSLTLKGYGAIGVEFSRFVRLIKGMDKHIVFIFHAKEEKDGDLTKLRIAIEGQTKDNIWKSIDIGGFMEMLGKDRTIGFTNCEKYYAKGVHGVKGVYQVPELKGDAKDNVFITNLFEGMRSSIINEQEETEDKEAIYLKAMKILNIIKKCETAEHINLTMAKILKAEHALTSEKELKHHLNEKAVALGLKFDRKEGKYVPNNDKPTE